MNPTADALQQILPRAPLVWIQTAIDECPKHGIDTPHELATFLAQCAQESAEFTRLEENLNYSAVRLAQVWARFSVNPEASSALRVPNDLAYSLERNPMALANYIYDDANRGPKYKLGNTSPGDGWLHRGAGPMQVTGKKNQEACSKDMGIPIERFIDLVKTPFYGIRSAIWVWKTHDLDAVDDDDDQMLDTRRINGGLAGLAQRQAYADKLFKSLEGT